MSPVELATLCTQINGGATIDDVLLQSLLMQGRTMLFSERPWMFLRRTDTTVSVSANSDSWNTPISVSGITDLLKFYQTDLGRQSYSIVLYNSSTDQKEYYRQVPWSKRLEYKNVPNTFVYDMIGKKIYINGNIPFSGVLYMNIIMRPPAIVIDSDDAMDVSGSFPAPAEYVPVLAYYAVGINKGAIDYDDINRQMLPQNQAALSGLKSAMVSWDTDLQLNEQSATDPTGGDSDGFVGGRINMNA